jgi:hypothetical protein
MTQNSKLQGSILLSHVPPEFLRELAKTKSGFSLKKLYEDQETLVDEVFRLFDSKTIQVVCDEFPGPENYATWFFRPLPTVARSEIATKVKSNLTRPLFEGITPRDVGEVPTLYRVEETASTMIFRFVASDQTQRLQLSFGEKTAVPIFNYYSAIFHFSELSVLIFGPYANAKATSVIQKLDSELGLKLNWALLKPERGKSRQFFDAIKHNLAAHLVETKRHDPAGNYKTVALEAREKHPDLERVADFRKVYFNADAYYDVLQYSCTNALGLKETTRVKFGHPFGRFIFRMGTSLSAILHFQKNVLQIL